MSLVSLPYHESELSLLADLIHERTGNQYPPERYELLAGKLEPLVLESGAASFLDFYYRLKYEGDAQRWEEVQRALAVNETYFWREYDAIEAAANLIIPQLQLEKGDAPVRIWHAGCASGEEPYTMAIALQENGRYFFGPIEILGTDYNRTALAHARAGLYRQSSFRTIPAEIRERYFQPLDRGPWRYALAPTVREKVQFRYLNLMDAEAIRALGRFDLIFCRNVFIYFSQEAIRMVTDAMYDVLNSPGYLFTAATESLLRVTDRFDLQPVGKSFVYVKQPIREAIP